NAQAMARVHARHGRLPRRPHRAALDAAGRGTPSESLRGVAISGRRARTRVFPMAEAVPSPRTDDTKAPDEQKKVHRAETKTKTTVAAKPQGPTLDIIKADERVRSYSRCPHQHPAAIGH